jgi:hypothetical protein
LWDLAANPQLCNGIAAIARYHQGVRNQKKKNEKHSAYRTAGKKGTTYV